MREILKHIPPANIIGIFIGLVLSVVWNIPHLVDVYVDYINTEESNYHYIMFSIIEFSIFIMVVNDYPWFAKLFAFFIFVLNLYFYFPESTTPEFSFAFAWVATPGVLLSAIPAFAISFFSDLFFDKIDWKTDSEELEMVRVQIGTLRVEIENNRKTIDIYRPAFESISEFRGESINISGVKATVCKCSRLVKAGSNKQGSYVCECGELIEWN